MTYKTIDPTASAAGKALRALRKTHEGRPAVSTRARTARSLFARRTSVTIRLAASRTRTASPASWMSWEGRRSNRGEKSRKRSVEGDRP
jgi:hypothetical protein